MVNFYNIFSLCVIIAFIKNDAAHTLVDPNFQFLNNGNTGPLFQTVSTDKQLEDANFWYTRALQQLSKTIKNAERNEELSYLRKAKNIIIFIGDGMGPSSVTMGRIYKGQYINNKKGEEEELTFEKFLNTGIIKTYNVDKQVPDSAGTATAIFCGSKTNYYTLGMDATRSATNGTIGSLRSIMDWAQEENKRTGIVTTTRITHATPAATYARVQTRKWECDSEIPEESKPHYIDIARQLVEKSPGNHFNVILGGGLIPLGSPNVNETFVWDSINAVCNRSDGLNLVSKWLESRPKSSRSAFVRTKAELEQINLKKIDHLMGLFTNSHMSYGLLRKPHEPSLKEMTEAAIDVLDRGDNSNGFVLMVESGRVDHGHHQNYARAALHEILELDLAVEAALAKTNAKETLIIVTADHSHSVTMNGYPDRGNDILGVATFPNLEANAYETITYANGPGYNQHIAIDTAKNTIWKPLKDFTKEERSSPTYRHRAALPLTDETHGGEDVVAYACGPGSSLVRGVFEQNYLAFVMSYAGCMGPAKLFDSSCVKPINSAYTSSANKISQTLFTTSIFFIANVFRKLYKQLF